MKILQLGQFESTDHLHIFAGSFFHHQDIFFHDELNCYKPVKLTKDERLAIHEISVLLYQEYIPKISKHLNEQNHLHMSLRFWHPFLANWLGRLIPNIIEKYVKIEKFISLQSEPLKLKLIHPQNEVNILDDYNFSKVIVHSSEFNHYLSSIIFESKKLELESKGWIFEYQKENLCFEEKVDDTNLNYKSLSSQSVEHITGVGQIGLFVLNFFAKFNLKKTRKEFFLDRNFNFDQTTPNLDWMKIFLPLCPKSYFDIKKHLTDIKIKRSFYIFSTYKHPIKKRIMASLASEKGARVYLSQHGSDYGDLYTSTHAYLTEYSVDGFISWGWDKHDHHPANIVPMPSPVLSKLRVRRLFARKSNKIIFASTVYAPNSAGMCMRIDADELRDSFDNLKIFLSSLNPEALKNFYYRPRPTHHSFGFDTYKQIQKLFPQIKKHTGVFDQEAACAKLIVHDNVGSTLHKSVAAKIPVLFFWRKDQILLNDYISERLEQLEKEKIYFRDPKEASNFINEISSDPLKFNYNFDAIDFYRKKYCQSSLFYFFSWIKCMLKL